MKKPWSHYYVFCKTPGSDSPDDFRCVAEIGGAVHAKSARRAAHALIEDADIDGWAKREEHLTPVERQRVDEWRESRRWDGD